MPGHTTPISPELQRRVECVARWIWSAVIVMAGVIIGALAARSYDARRDHALRQSPAGPQYGHIIPRLQLDQPTLREAIKVLIEKSGATVDVDWVALKDLGVKFDKPLELQWDLRNISLDQVLEPLLRYTPMSDPDKSNYNIQRLKSGSITVI